MTNSLDSSSTNSRHLVAQTLPQQGYDEVFPSVRLDQGCGHRRKGEHQPLPQSPASEMTLDEEIADLMHQRPRRSLFERLDEDVQVVP